MPLGEPIDDRHYDVENPRMDGDPENPENPDAYGHCQPLDERTHDPHTLAECKAGGDDHDPELWDGDESSNLIIWIIIAGVITIAAIIGVVLLLRGNSKKAVQTQMQAGDKVNQTSPPPSAEPDQLSEHDKITGKTEIEVSEDPEAESCLSTVATAAGAAVAGIGLTAAGIYAYKELKPKIMAKFFPPPEKTGLAAYIPDKMPSAGACLAGAAAVVAAGFGIKKAYDVILSDFAQRFADIPENRNVQLILKDGAPVEATIVSHATGNRQRKCVVCCEGDQLTGKQVKQIRWKVEGSWRSHFYNLDDKATTKSVGKSLDDNATAKSVGNSNFEIVEEVRRTALLITITYAHIGEDEGRLPGTRDDGFRMKKFLQKRGFRIIWMRDFEADETKDMHGGEELKMLNYNHEKYPSAENIKNTIKKIVSEQDAGDVLWFHYSGHGGQLPDDNGDETDNEQNMVDYKHSTNKKGPKDEVLVSADYKSNRTSYNDAMVRDDFLRDEFANKLPAEMESFIVFDCCHSGTMFDMDYMYQYDDKTKQVVEPSSNDDKSKKVKLSGKAVYLSGCRDNECAAELTWRNGNKISKRGGALTFALLELLKDDTISIRDLLTRIDIKVNKRDQEPCLSANYELDVDTPFRDLIDGVTK